MPRVESYAPDKSKQGFSISYHEKNDDAYAIIYMNKATKINALDTIHESYKVAAIAYSSGKEWSFAVKQGWIHQNTCSRNKITSELIEKGFEANQVKILLDRMKLFPGSDVGLNLVLG